MSLHGEIMVNDKWIGKWSARRLKRLTSPKDVHTYHVEVCDHSGLVYTGQLLHRYSDGALVLLRKVMEAATNAATVTPEITPAAETTTRIGPKPSSVDLCDCDGC